MTAPEGTWSSDVKISMPQPIDPKEILLDMGSHAFTANGLFHNINSADLQELFSPTFAPPVVTNG